MIHIEDLIVIVRWLALIVAIIDCSLVVYILIRRMNRNHYLAQKDTAHQQFSAYVQQVASGASYPQQAATGLSRARTRAEIEAVQELLLAAITEANRTRLSDLLLELGYINRWATQAFGARRAKALVEQIKSGKAPVPGGSNKRNFRKIRRLRMFAVRRALPVVHFGHLAPIYAEVFLSEALRDPSPYVTRPAVSALGKTVSPGAVPILLEQLGKAAKGQSEIPVRAAKASLVRHSADKWGDFFPLLESGDEQYRLLIVDTIREILNAKPSLAVAKDFPADLYRWFVNKSQFDVSADVRARSAAVIRHFHDHQSVSALRALLSDENEYVRLHAARACADPFYSELAENLVVCMTDRRWRVRESAAKSLAAVGSAGAQSLADFFLATNDRYASEQIADELQRSGMIFQLISVLGTSDLEADKAVAVCRKMAGLGMTSLFSYLSLRETSERVRNELAKILAACPDRPSGTVPPRTPVKSDDTRNRTAPFPGIPATQTTIAAGE